MSQAGSYGPNLPTLTDGELYIGVTGGAVDPAPLTAGAGISIANGPGSITISGVGGGIGWLEVTSTSATMSGDNGYVANNAALVTLTLPATCAFGCTLEIVGKGAGLWKIAQNAGQAIHFGTVDTTTGVGGSVTATEQYDTLILVCTQTDTEFTVKGSQGNLTVT